MKWVPEKLLLLLLLCSHPVLAALPFATAVAEYRQVGSTYIVDAVIEAGRQATVATQVTGKIMELRVDAGDAVKQGQIIARIDDSESHQSVLGNQAQAAQAQANLTNAQSQYDRTRQLVSRKFVSQSSLDQARASLDSAQAQLAAARAGVGQASATRGFSVITAPFSGLIAERLAQAGDMASLGHPLITLFDPATLRVLAPVPESMLDKVRKAVHARVEITATGKWIDASRITILPEADNKTHVSHVRIELPKDTVGSYPGMFARVYFDTVQINIVQNKMLTVPSTAIVRRSEVTGVYVVNPDGRIQFRQVRLGEPADLGFTPVFSGLTQGEHVALEPTKAGIYQKRLQGKE